MSDDSAPRFSYPVFLDLHDVAVLVVGGGRIGARKADGLLAAGARVRLVADSISHHVDRDRIADIRERRFDESDLDGVRLVITATGDEETDRAVSAAARGRGIWVNAADQPVDCDWILPAITRAGRVTAAISTDGASPALAQRLRDQVAELVDQRAADAAETLAAHRAQIQATGASTEDIDWQPIVNETLGDGAQTFRVGNGSAASPNVPSWERFGPVPKRSVSGG